VLAWQILDSLWLDRERFCRDAALTFLAASSMSPTLAAEPRRLVRKHIAGAPMPGGRQTACSVQPGDQTTLIELQAVESEVDGPFYLGVDGVLVGSVVQIGLQNRRKKGRGQTWRQPDSISRPRGL